MEVSLILVAVFVVITAIAHGMGFRRGIKVGIKQERRRRLEAGDFGGY